MSDDESRVKALFAGLPVPSVGVEARGPEVDRERMVAAILQAAREPTAKTRVRVGVVWLGAAAVALAAAAALAVIFGRSTATPQLTTSAGGPLVVDTVKGDARRWHAGVGHPLAVGAASTSDGDLTTGEASEVRLHRNDGLAMEVGASSRLSLAGLSSEPNSNIELLSGSVSCRVPRQFAGHFFSVVTPDAQVVVHGTTFTVTVGNATGTTRTCVQVTEGVVAVRARAGETLVSAGQSWGSCKVSAQSARQAAEPPASVTPEQLGVDVVPPQRKPTAEHKTPSTARPSPTLEEESRLLQAGLSAERNGQTAAATIALNRLLTRYPDSPLATDARAALQRLARSNGPQP